MEEYPVSTCNIIASKWESKESNTLRKAVVNRFWIAHDAVCKYSFMLDSPFTNGELEEIKAQMLYS